ncbi:hypothetical protein LTR08_008819 [Meristemomyces frigidus]|nr:hypothetical protein LTR08_008819 [Meristemomyces frigidus]
MPPKRRAVGLHHASTHTHASLTFPQQPDADDSASPEPATHRRRTTANPSNDVAETAFAGDDGTPSDSSVDQMVKKLVRLALACEYQRRPIRRADISEKVLGAAAARQFKSVFAHAQLQLQTVFGMIMVELPAREKVTLQQRRAAQKTAEKSKTTTSWVLTTILPDPFRHPEILQPPAAPTVEEESKYSAVYTTLISLISLSGGQLPDTKMDRYLRRLQMEDTTPVDSHARTENLLKRLEKEGYVVKIKESTGTGEEDVYWTVGSRGKVEVGEDGVRGLVRAVYGDLDEDGEEELERKTNRSLGVGDRTGVKPKEGGETKKRGRKKKEVREEDEDGVGGDTEEDE